MIDDNITIHHSYSTTGPGGSYLVVLGWIRNRASAKQWDVSLWRQEIIPSRWSWLPWVRPQLKHTLVRREAQKRRLVTARESYELVKADADRMATAQPTAVETDDGGPVGPPSK